MTGAAAAAERGARSAAPGRRRRAWLLLATVALLVALPHVPGLQSDFGRSLLTQMGIAAVFALSFNLLFGQTGLLSFGHAVYFGLGGYAAIGLMRAINHGLPLPMLVVPLAGAAGGLLAGVLFGAVTTKRAGTIFALISLGVGELVFAATFMLPGIFGGEEGITASRTRATIDFGFPLASPLRWRCTRSRAHPSGACAMRCATIPSARNSSATTRSACALSHSRWRDSSPASPAGCMRSITKSSRRTRSARRARAPC